MSQTCFSTTQDMPMCERKDVLDKLQEMVNDLEKTQKSIRQVPRVLIRSNFCECRKGNKEHSAAALQKERAQEKIPPQYFDYPQPAQLQGKPKPGLGGDGSASTCGDGVASADGCKAPVASNPLETAGGAECLQPDVKPKVTPSKSVREKERTCQKTPVVQQSAADNKTRLCNEDPLPEERKIDGPHPLIPVPQPHTYELRASKMIVGCDCLRRNGMQHDCQRTLCQGKRECLKFPAPVCQPSGLAPPIIIPSHIITADEPDCGPKRPKEKTKTQIEQRKILLNYARSQFQDKPPRPLNKLGSCKYHKKGKYYIRPLQRIAHTQTDNIEDTQLNEEASKK